MKQKVKIGNFEAGCLLLNLLLYKIILDFPRNVAEDAGSAGWIMTLLVSLVVLMLFYILSKLYKWFEGQDILDVSEQAMGGPGRLIIGIVFLLKFLVIVPIVLRQFAEDIKVISLTFTPISIIILIFSIGMLVGAYLGIESLARIHALVVPVLAAAFLIILAMSIPRFDLSRLAPWLGLGPEAMIRNGVNNLSIYSELLVLFLIMPFLHKQSDFSGIGKFTIFIAGFFFVVSTAVYQLVYQYPTATEFFLPMYQLARSLMVGRFFTRIEAAFIVIWASSAFLYLSSGLYFITFLFHKSFGLQYQKPLLIPFAILVFTLSMVPENLYSTLRVQMDVYRRYAWVIAILLPVAILLMARARIRSKKKKEALAE